MKDARWKPLAGLVGLALLAALLVACGGDDDESQEAGPSTSSATVVIPFDTCIGFYPLFVAEAEGHFAENDIEVEVEAVDGSGAALQALLGGRADIAVPNLFDVAQSVDEGAPLQVFYSVFQRPTFSLFAPADSRAADVEDLGDQVVGISTPGAGDATFAEMQLAAAGLEGNELLSVGGADGGIVALRNERVAAYSTSFFEGIIIEQQLPLRALAVADFPQYADTLVTSTSDWVSENPDFITSFGRALAESTAWAQEHTGGVLDICTDANPEEIRDRDLAQTLLEATFEKTELPPEADGNYGFTRIDAQEEAIELLVDVGAVSEAPPSDIFTNEFVEAYNSPNG